jgi:SAM-dependent methyltransferase
MNTIQDPEALRSHIRSRYAAVATGGGCCGPNPTPSHKHGAREDSSACCGAPAPAGEGIATECQSGGYDLEALSQVPEGANLGLGCGNPVALGALRPGEVVLDLGSGGGLDCFLAARAVGPTGRVIGVDMTPEMIERARRNAKAGHYDQVEFRLGEIEHLPVADGTVDVVLSNCVINLAPDKAAVFREIKRVLKPGGRAYLSDIALAAPLPESVRENPDAIAGCVGGALLVNDYRSVVIGAGLVLDRFETRGSQMARHAAAGTTSPDPLAAETVAVAGAAIDLVRSVDIVARNPH